MNIDGLISMAKERILEDGQHAPTIFLEMEEEVTFIALDFLPDTTFEREKLFFSIGRMIGKESPATRIIQQIAFVTEAWVSEQPSTMPLKYKRPSEDPNRKEMLIMLVLDCTPGLKQFIHRVEMLRDGSGKLVDLLHISTLEEAQGNLLTSFLAGYSSAHMSEKDLLHLIRKANKQ